MAKTYKMLTADVNEPIEEIVVGVQQDVNSRYLDVTLTDGGTPIDLTGRRVHFSSARADGVSFYKTGVITNAKKGRCMFELTGQELKAANTLYGQFEIWKEYEKVLTTPILTIHVVESLRDNSNMESSNEYGALVILYQNMYEIKDQLTESQKIITESIEVLKQIYEGQDQLYTNLQELYTNLDTLRSEQQNLYTSQQGLYQQQEDLYTSQQALYQQQEQAILQIGNTNDTGGTVTEGTLNAKANEIIHLVSEMKNQTIENALETHNNAVDAHKALFDKKLDETEFTGENVADLLEGIGWKGGEGSAAENNHILNGPNHGIKQINANVSGKDASAFGTGTASGQYAHAEGYQTTAGGNSSHAEGYSTTASGFYAHAEGNQTTASGNASHAEGYNTTASGDYAHAEGHSTTASGDYAHAEGYSTIASGRYAHAEGSQTNASGEYAHAEGVSTTAGNDYAHAEGYGTTANGGSSHAEGYSCYADGQFGDHAGGNGSVAVSNDTVLWIAKAEGTEITIDSSGKYQPASDVKTKLGEFEAGQELFLLNVYYANAGFHKKKVVSVNAANYKIVIDSAVPTEKVNFKLLINPAAANTAAYYPNYAQGTKCISIGGYSSYAEGYQTVALGNSSHGEGFQTTASGNYTHAEGYSTIASGDYAHAEGYSTIASGRYAHAEGSQTNASGEYAHAEGSQTNASGAYSHAGGYLTEANGTCSYAEGYTITANGWQHAAGKFNTSASGASSVSSTSGSAFVIGNGTSASAKSNCFRVQYNGQVFGKGAYSSSGADYAELFEWADGNESAQDRRGKFVALQGTKIHIANSFDDNIIGIISHKPSVMGNNHSETWANMYLTDMWGEEKTERKIIPATYREEKQEDGSIKKIQITEAYEDDVPIINPAYDPSKKYIPRHERKEWGIVGMLGQLIAEDDGSCEPGGFCRCSEGGVATKSDAGYYVMERLDTHYIRILFR